MRFFKNEIAYNVRYFTKKHSINCEMLLSLPSWERGLKFETGNLYFPEALSRSLRGSVAWDELFLKIVL